MQLAAPAEGADLPRLTPPRGAVSLAFLISLVVYWAFIPRLLRFSNPPTGDQAFYLMDTISLAQDGDLDVANNYAARDEDKFYSLAPHPPGFVAVGAPYPLAPQLAKAGARPFTEQYSYHVPGLPLLLVPAWIAGGWFRLWWPATMVFLAILAALVAANVFLFAYELTGRLPIAWAVWLPVAFSSPVMTYSCLAFTELPTGLLGIYALRRLALGWDANGPIRLALVGVFIGGIPWLAWRCLPVAAALGLYALVQFCRMARRGGRFARAITATLPLAVPIAVLAALMARLNLFRFESVLPKAMPEGELFEVMFARPWNSVDELREIVNASAGLLFDKQWGLVTHAPLYLLASLGALAMALSARRSDRRLLAWILLTALPYLAVIACYRRWHGQWSPPARYLATFAPLLAGPLAFSLLALGRSRLYKALFAALALLGLVFMAAYFHDPRLMFPVNRGFFWDWWAADPAAPFHVDVRGLLPATMWPDYVRQPLTTGWVLAAALAVTALGHALLVRRGAIPWRPSRPFRRAAGWTLAIAAVGGAWLFVNTFYLRPKTLLVEERRWPIKVRLLQPGGIAPLSGGHAVAFSDYTGRSVGLLDLDTGAGRLLRATSQGRTVELVHPGDVKEGADGLLYVLNNGEGEDALLVMRATGEIVRRVALPGTAAFSAGLALGGGDLLVADRGKGRLLVYDAEGHGPRVASAPSGLNNVTSVAIAADGTAYVTQLSPGRVLAFAPRDGRLIREYDTHCAPSRLASAGAWLEVACEDHIASIDTETGALRLAWATAGRQPESPGSLSYGPDGKLYVVNEGDLVRYRVQR